ncbi:MAG: hypothetical protein WB678_09175 [Stellaceae bacterium]
MQQVSGGHLAIGFIPSGDKEQQRFFASIEQAGERGDRRGAMPEHRQQQRAVLGAASQHQVVVPRDLVGFLRPLARRPFEFPEL